MDEQDAKSNQGLMDLAHMITSEEETLARCRRMEETAVMSFLSSVSVSFEITPLSMNIVRFGMSVAEYRVICRKVASIVLIPYPSPAETCSSNNNSSSTPKIITFGHLVEFTEESQSIPALINIEGCQRIL